MNLFGTRRPEPPPHRSHGVTPPIIVAPTHTTPGEVSRGMKIAVIDSVDNAQFPQYATVLIENHTPGEMGYAIPAGSGPFAAGGTTGYSFFYSNIAGKGGSICYVDCDRHIIVSFTGQESSQAPTPYYKALADHKHSGNLDPDQFIDPQPINLSNGEIQSLLPYQNHAPAFQSAIDSTGALLATYFPGGLKRTTSGAHPGMYQFIAPTGATNLTVKSSIPITIQDTQALCCNWDLIYPYSQIPLTAQWGPAIFDGAGNHLWFQFYFNDQSGFPFCQVVALTSTGAFANWSCNGSPQALLYGPYTHTYSLCAVAQGKQSRTNPVSAYFDTGMLISTTQLGATGAFGNTWMQSGPWYPGFIIKNSPVSAMYIKEFSLTTSIPHEQMTKPYQNNFNALGDGITSKMFLSTLQNVTSYITDATIHYSVGTTTPYVLTYWYDNGTAGQDAKVYATDNTSGTSDRNIGHTTSAAPSGTYNTGLSGAGTVYGMLYYNVALNKLVWTWQNSPFSGPQIRTAYADGAVSIFATLNTDSTTGSGFSIAAGGGGGGSRTGNGGKTIF